MTLTLVKGKVRKGSRLIKNLITFKQDFIKKSRCSKCILKCVQIQFKESKFGTLSSKYKYICEEIEV